MYIFLKEESINENVFINTIINNEYLHLQFNHDNPFIETDNDNLSTYILSTFPNLFSSSSILPKFNNKKNEEVKESDDSIKVETTKDDKIDTSEKHNSIPRRRGRPSNN